jgi:ketosteroid isomerase-like protein
MAATHAGVRGEADELLRAAHETAHRWPAGFRGFRAGLRYATAELVAEGAVAVRRGPDVQLEIDLPDDDRRSLQHELSSLAGHRWERPYEEGDGRLEKQVHADDGHPLGRLVELDDKMDSAYRVGDGRLNAITRTHGGTRFTIAIQGRAEAPDGRTVSNAFTVLHWADGRLVRSDAYTDEFAAVGGLLLPRVRQVVTARDEGLSVRRLELHDHELIAGEDAR